MRIVSSGVAILSLIISRKWLGGLSLNAPQNKSRQCPDSEIRNISISPFSEFRNRKDTSNVLIPSVVLVSKFARRSISECGELRKHETSNLLNLVWFLDLKFLKRECHLNLRNFKSTTLAYFRTEAFWMTTGVRGAAPGNGPGPPSGRAAMASTISIPDATWPKTAKPVLFSRSSV